MYLAGLVYAGFLLHSGTMEQEDGKKLGRCGAVEAALQV